MSYNFKMGLKLIGVMVILLVLSVGCAKKDTLIEINKLINQVDSKNVSVNDLKAMVTQINVLDKLILEGVEIKDNSGDNIEPY